MLTLTLTDGNGIEGLQAQFGSYIDTSVVESSISAAAAAASAAAALVSQNNASNSATASSASAAAALVSQNAAAASATAAAGSAANASDFAGDASASATAAAGSATSAATQAGNAATSAGAAATSASNAAATLANALTKANNLSDVANVATARANLGLGAAALLATPIPIASGGTGSTTAPTALTALGGQPTNNPTFTGAVGVPTRTAGDSTANAASTAFIAASIASFSGRNRIINGTAVVAQWPAITVPIGNAGYSGPDRFKAQNGAAVGTFNQTQGSITFGGVVKSAVKQTVVAAFTTLTGTNVWGGISQLIEGLNCFDMLGEAATLSFIFETNVSGTYSVSIVDSTGANSFVSSFVAVANTPIKVVIPIASLPTTLAVSEVNTLGLYLRIGALNAGTYQTSTANSWTAGNFTSLSGAVNWGSTIGNFISATDIQFESGSVATPFERRSVALELLLCYRYFQTYTFNSSFTGAITFGANNAVGYLIPQTVMRSTVVASTISGGFVADMPTIGNIGLSSYNFADGVVQMLFTSGTAMTVGLTGLAMVTASPSVIGLNSEL